jgi:hypothetical protein
MPAKPIPDYSKGSAMKAFDGAGSNATQHMALPETTGQAEVA